MDILRLVFVFLISFLVLNPQAHAVLVGEEDGSPSHTATSCWALKVANGNLTANADGTCSVADQGGGAGGDNVTVNGTAADTTANFKDNIYLDFVHTDGGAGGPDDVTGIFNYALTLSGNPALLVDECVLFADTSGGGFLCEGSTADTDEQLYRFPDVNGSDTTNYFAIDGTSITDLDGSGLAISSNALVLDLTEINSATFGSSGGFTTLTFDSGATDPSLTPGDGTITLTPGGNDFIVSDDTRIQDASPVLRLIDTTGSQDDFQLMVDTNAFTLLNETDSVNYFAAASDHAITVGHASVPSVTITTDGSGTGELVLPLQSVAGAEIVNDTLTATQIDETQDYTFATLSGKQDRNNTAVNDDDCSGEQGLWWYDTTDSAFEFCNANTGAPSVLGGGGSGDSVSIDSAAVTDPDFVSTGQIDFVDTSNTVTANINDNSILEADLKAVDAASDEDILTYETTTGDFEWHTIDQMIAAMSAGALPNDSILEADLKAVDAASDEECLTYETTTGDFEWQSCGAGGSGATDLSLPVFSAKIQGTFALDQDATQGARIDGGDGNWRLLFDATTDEGAVWQFVMPSNYTGSPSLKVIYSMTSATANEVEFEGAIMCVTPGDAADIGSASFSAIAVASDTVPGTAGHSDSVTITLTDDSCAAGDTVFVYLSTDADDATNDDATGDREVVGVLFDYS